MGLAKQESLRQFLLKKNNEVLICPEDGNDLIFSEDHTQMECPECDRAFFIDSGIPLLFWGNDWDSKTDVTEVIQAFYEKTPFPNYENMDSISTFVEKARKKQWPVRPFTKSSDVI